MYSRQLWNELRCPIKWLQRRNTWKACLFFAETFVWFFISIFNSLLFTFLSSSLPLLGFISACSFKFWSNYFNLSTSFSWRILNILFLTLSRSENKSEFSGLFYERLSPIDYNFYPREINVWPITSIFC